jgi:hypothetical protein
MYRAAVGVNANVGLHAKVPLAMFVTLPPKNVLFS